MNPQDALFEVQMVGMDRDHALARISDPATSYAADAELRKREGPAWALKRGTHRHRALECFATRGPLIAEDVKFLTGIDGIWKRVSDLKNMRFIEATGDTRLSREGREAEVYEITDAGRAAYERLGAVE
jgi:hypothetical protein